MRWLRLYDEIIDDPKILQLSVEFRWNFVQLLAIANRQPERGTLPNLHEIAIHMRLTLGKATRVIDRLTEAGFIDKSDDGKVLMVHAWNKRQFKSDDITSRSSASKERSRERSHQRGEERSVEAETETETEAKGESPPPPLASLPPEYTAVARHAEEQGGDVSWAIWSDRMGRAGHPASSIRRAIDEAAGCGKLSQAYAAKILQRWAVEGPPNGRAAPPPAPPVERKYVTAGPEHIHPKFRRHA